MALVVVLSGCNRGDCAYRPDAKGPVILMLMDINDPDGWAFYSSSNATTGGAVRHWPSAADLQSKFMRSRKYTPQEAIANIPR